MFSKELEVTISQAYQEARTARHEFLTVEHLLLALLDNSSALSVLSACGADINELEAELRKALHDTVPVLEDDDSRDTQPTIGFQRVLQRALYHVQSAGKQEVIGSNVLVAHFQREGFLRRLPAEQIWRHPPGRGGLHLARYRRAATATTSGTPEATEALEEGAESRSSALDNFTTNLNARAPGRQDRPADRP